MTKILTFDSFINEKMTAKEEHVEHARKHLARYGREKKYDSDDVFDSDDVLDFADDLMIRRPDLKKKIEHVMYNTIDVENIRHNTSKELNQAMRELQALESNGGEQGAGMGGLKVKTSTIPHAGNGLFTTKLIKKGEDIAEYTGTVITAKEADAKADAKDGSGDYLITLNSKKVLDVFGSKCLAGIANDAEGFQKLKGYSNNAEIYQDSKSHVWLAATKDIPAGSEIFVAYGKAYWDNWKANNPQEKKVA